MTGMWLRLIVRDEVLVTVIQLCTCYFVYYTAQSLTTLKANGELSVIVFGMFINSYGKTKIYYDSDKVNIKSL